MPKIKTQPKKITTIEVKTILTYTSISKNIQSICENGRGLSSEAKNIISDAVEIINKEMNASKKFANPTIKNDCDYIFVGALISAMAKSDEEHSDELTHHAQSGTDSELGDFLYPIDSSEVHKQDVTRADMTSITKGYNLRQIGLRALKDKSLPFTGSFNPACFPGLDQLFEPEHFNEYHLHTDPSTMIHPLTKKKNQHKIEQPQQQLAKELNTLISSLLVQFESARERSNHTDPLSSLMNKVSYYSRNFADKLNNGSATDDNMTDFKNTFKQVIDEHKTIINEHRGLFIVRGIMDALAEIERWMRQLPTSVYGRPFSLAHKDTFFSTKTARVAEDTCNKIDRMFSPSEVR